MHYDVIITAAGSGTRTGLDYNKIFLQILDKPCIVYSIQLFLKDADVNNVFITIQQKDEIQMEQILIKYNLKDRVKLILGSNTRQKSVYNALKFVKSSYVLIHDGARPFVQLTQIQDLKQRLNFDKAAILAIPATDTLKSVDACGQVARTIPRTNVYYAQTPQGFETDIILKAHEQAVMTEFEATDDAQLVEHYSNDYDDTLIIQIVQGNKYNIKITSLEDIVLAESYAIVLKKLNGGETK
jgi:2-C-methyl-D-erythritol 4-phosphate cytidylyltransferase